MLNINRVKISMPILNVLTIEVLMENDISIFFQLGLYNPIFGLIALLPLLIITYKCALYIKVLRILHKVPGPKGYPILGNTKLLLLSPEDLFSILAKYSEMYNPVFKVIVGHSASIFTSHPGDVEMVLSQMKHLQKGIQYRTLEDWLGEGLLLSSGSKWQLRRKLLTPTFHFTILSQFVKVFAEETNKLVRDIGKALHEPVDVFSLVTNFTLQSICDTAMGTELETLEDRENYVKAICKMGKISVKRIVTPWQHSNFLYKFSFDYWKSKLTLNYLHKFTTNVIKFREKSFNLADMELKENYFNTRKQTAMLDLLLLAKLKDNSIDEMGIREEVDTFMFEGHDTTAVSITLSIMLLANHKDIQEKVCEELRSILNGSRRDFTMDDLNEMKYLERVIKESLRLYPSVPFISRYLSEDVTTPSGYFLPKDTTVTLSIYYMQRDSKYYENPERFDPDRFIPENMKGKHPYAYIPFSAGPRNCIGQKFAMLEMKIAIASILRNFELFPIDTPDTIQLKVDIILKTTTPILVKFCRREGSVF